MITKAEIEKLAIEWVYSQETHARAADALTAFAAGFQAATEQLQAENARLREDNAALEARTAHLSTFRSEALGAMQESRDVIHNLRAENERLREALQALVDEQNDAPLERRRAEWEKAIEKAKNALK